MTAKSSKFCSHCDQNKKAADVGILKYQEVCGKSAKGRKMAEENNGNNLCESSDSIMTILDQMADSVQLDYTDQFSKDVEPTSSGLLELEQSKVCFPRWGQISYEVAIEFSYTVHMPL